MTAKSKIEWTEITWNPLTGCSKISPGCKNCYAERMSYRLKAMGQPNYKNGFKVSLHKHALETPLTIKKPQIIFVNSMSDLFHKSVPTDFIKEVFDVMKRAHWHRFQVLTKRSKRLRDLSPSLSWFENVWMGVSIENSDYLFRIDHLRETGALTKFISFEPLLGHINKPNLNGIDWVVVGGESGPHARPMDASWVIDIKNKCNSSNIPFFFKQWGGKNKKKAGRLLENQTWDELPVIGHH